MPQHWQQLFGKRLAETEDLALPKVTPRSQHLFELPGKADAVIGMRRVGKSCFLLSRIGELLAAGVARSRILYFDFEDELFADLGGQDLGELEEAFYARHPESRGAECWFFFDEIQEVPGWEKFVRRLIGQRNLHLVVTGSSARLLSHEIATSLRGRALTTELLPFSFREVLAHRGVMLPAKWPEGGAVRSRLRREFDRFLSLGGFPEVQSFEPEPRRATLQSYLEIALLRDVAERHAIRNLPALRFILRRLLRSVGSHATANALHQDLKSQGLGLAKDHVYDFLGHFEDTRLLFLLPLRARSERQRQMNPRKVYAIDHGLVAACVPPTSADTGHHLENLVYLELRRRGEVIGYHRTASGREVDFVWLDRHGDQHLVQVCADLGDDATRKRELGALAEAMDEVPHESAFVVSIHEDGFAKADHKEVRLVPAWRWLAMP